MNPSERDRSVAGGPVVDPATLIAISMLAYIAAVFLHEYFGHALACLLLGGRLIGLGAFYVNYDDAAVPDAVARAIAAAGPLASLLTGMLALLLLGRLSPSRGDSAPRPPGRPHLRYGLWLFGTVSLMTATGYLLYSGATGIGDFGTGAVNTRGVFAGAKPEWAVRAGLFLAGIASYAWVIRVSLRRMDAMIGGAGEERVRRAQRLSLTSYLTGATLYILVGLLNPIGIVIVLISAAASSLGGTSGLAWMMQLLDRRKETGMAPFTLPRRWSWIAAGAAVSLLYAIVLGPTRQP